ncbi:hypothetical protein RRG08_032841 [Elysia crispata]|uniref:Uncharacterized protein n=1 Tax=Elysia crispata TaxID=231223 RepID=A0AAE1AFJ1_9GAST|nr:hypothetical protein RRG08_032841 [Elysia crispata]
MALSLIVVGLGFLLARTEGAAVGRCIRVNSYTHDDRSCQVYHVCMRGGWVAATCPPAQVFNPSVQNCVAASLYRCPDTPGCSPGTCLNGGRCIPTLDGLGQCRCLPGFTGNRCQTATGGTGSVTGGSTGGGTSSTADTCTDLKCVNGGRCFKESAGKAQCYCPSPFGGPLCGRKLNSDGVCPVPKESTCDPACENGGKCFEADGKPKCFCPEGFNGDRCELTLGQCNLMDCQNGGECNEDSDGKATCTCPKPYSGKFCQLEVSDACYALKCENNAPCKRVGRTTVCDCPDGYIGDRCQYEDPCPNIKCLHGGKCETGDRGQAICNCAAGYTGNFCEIALDCVGFTCYNGGECKIIDNKRECVCTDWTKGDKCEKKLGCKVDGKEPCQNGGTCVTSQDGFQCICPLGRKGIYCDELRTCSENIVCENGGDCEDTKDEGAKCNCKKGFIGPKCEVKEDPCGGCQNGGVCELPSLLPADSPESMKLCACPAGFTGKLCEIESECTLPCSQNVGASGERYHTYVFPDLEKRDHVYLCRKGRVSRLKYCDEERWFDPFSLECHTEKSFAAARTTAGVALYPKTIPDDK